MRNEHIDHYISVATSGLPKNVKKDAAQELEDLISDMLENRCGSVLPNEHDIEVVLAELGGPLEFAEKYRPTQRSLISGGYYTGYIIVLKIVLIATLFGITLARTIELFTNHSVMWYMIILYWFDSLFPGLMIAFGTVTFIFALIERLKNIHHHHTGH